MKFSRRSVATLLVPASLGFLSACGNDDPAQELANLESYCETTVVLSSALGGTGGDGLPRGDQLRPETSRAAFDTLSPAIDTMQETAPEVVRDDLEIALEALRAAAAGDVSKVTGPAYETARQRLLDFSNSDCPQGSSSGDL